MKPITKAIIITSSAVLLIYLLLSGVLLYFSTQKALSVKDQAQSIIAALESREFDRAFIELVSAQETLDQAQQFQQPSRWISYLPVIGTDYLVYDELLSAGVELSSSLTFIIEQLTATSISTTLSLESIDLATTPRAYLEVHPQVIKAIAHLETAALEAENLHTEAFPESIRQEILVLQEQLDDVEETIAEFKPFLEQLPTILGAIEPQDMLVLLQNPHELRPTGGFIGSFGRVSMDKGEITQFFTEDVYNIDVFALGREEFTAPEPIQRYTEVDYWYFRDSNWSPDFSVSAQNAIKLYEFQTREEGIDTVIALTPFLVQEFLRLTGPIEVDGITFDETNLIDALQYRVEQEFWRIGLSDEERKTIINDLAQALKQRVFNLSSEELSQFYAIIMDALDRKEILVYTRNPELQALMEERRWAGHIVDTNSDYLAVFDANLGALKTDRLVVRNHEYSVIEQEDGTLKASLTLRYKNNGFFDYRTTRYRTYTRIYVPLGSQLLSSTGFVTTDKSNQYVDPEIYSEFEKTVFAGFISVEPGQERFARIEYTLPPNVQDFIRNNEKYELYVQKQSGIPQVETEVSIDLDHDYFSFAPSTVDYELTNTSALSFTDYPLKDTLYTIKLNP